MLNVADDPYGRRYYAHKNRIKFNEFKKTKQFKSWRNIQIRAQKYRCAYCRKRLDKENVVTHVDHVQPLYFDGSNSIDNLVLSCSYCNVKKWINDRVVYPEWIKENKRIHKARMVRSEQSKLMRQLVIRELDERTAYKLKQWL